MKDNEEDEKRSDYSYEKNFQIPNLFFIEKDTQMEEILLMLPNIDGPNDEDLVDCILTYLQMKYKTLKFSKKETAVMPNRKII